MPALSALRTMADHWWVVLIRGLFAILFGVLAYTWPGLSVLLLVTLWGAYALVDGIVGLVAGVRGKWGMLTVIGLLGIVAGVIAFVFPGLTAVTLLWVLAFWAIVSGVMQISAAVRLRKEVRGEWLWIVSGLLSIALGALFFLRPGEGILTVIWLLAGIAVVWGVMLVMLAFKLKGLKGRVSPAAQTA